MIEAQQKEIDGITFQFMPLFATPARDMLDQLIHKFGPSVASGVEGLQSAKSFNLESEMVSELIPALSGSLGGAIRSFCDAVQPGFHKNLVDTFFKQMHFQNENGDMQKLSNDTRELLFATKLMTEMKVLAWCLEVQYSDFFELLKKGSMLATLSLAKKKGSGLSSPEASTGQSSGSPPATDIPAL